jgi:putative oxidoreductase
MIGILHNNAVGVLVLRLTVGVLMLFHGISKVMHPGSVDFIGNTLSSAGLPSFIAYGVYIGEVVAPLMIVLGIHCRYGALILAANMVIAIMLVHTNDIFLLTEHGGWRLELQGFYMFSALAIVFLGSGRIAIKPD